MDKSLLTVPNGLTFLRFLGIPLFIYLTLSLHADGWAIAVLAIGGASDYFDGKLARAWGQTSRFGEIADPAIDRLYIFAILMVFMIREILPIWLIALLIGRDCSVRIFQHLQDMQSTEIHVQNQFAPDLSTRHKSLPLRACPQLAYIFGTTPSILNVRREAQECISKHPTPAFHRELPETPRRRTDA